MFNWLELSKGCTKGLLLVLNMFCIMIAVPTFGFAVADIRILKQYGEQQNTGSFTGDLVIIALCVFVVAACAFGCVATLIDNVRMLHVYILLVLLAVLLEIMIAIFVSVQRYGLQYRVSEWLRDDFFSNVTADGRVEHDQLWDDLQIKYECCGLNGPEDYAAIGRNISLSCCPRAYRARTAAAQHNMYRSCIDSTKYYSEGCEDEILLMLETDADWLIGVAIFSFWFEAACMMLAMWVANYIKNSVQVYHHTVKY